MIFTWFSKIGLFHNMTTYSPNFIISCREFFLGCYRSYKDKLFLKIMFYLFCLAWKKNIHQLKVSCLKLLWKFYIQKRMQIEMNYIILTANRRCFYPKFKIHHFWSFSLGNVIAYMYCKTYVYRFSSFNLGINVISCTFKH